MLPAIVLFVVILAGCQGSLPAPTSTIPGQQTPTRVDTGTAQPTNTAIVPTPTRSATPTPTVPPHLDLDTTGLRGVKIDFWHPWQGDLAARAEELVRAFNKENEWGLVVRVRSLYAPTGLAEALAATPAPDPLRAEERPEMVAALPEQLAEWQRQNQLVDLNDYTAAQDWGLSPNQISGFHAIFWDQDLGLGGQRAGIPALRTARVLFYNQTWASELGYPQAPTTPDEFQTQACAAAVANAGPRSEKSGTGGWLASTDALTTWSWFRAFGAQPAPQDSSGAYHFQSDEAGKAIRFLHTLFEKGCAWEGLSLTPHDYFANRMALLYAGSLQDLPFQAHAQERANSGDRWTILPFPSVEGEPLALTTGYSYGILVSTREKQMGAWLFTRYLLQPRNQALLAEVWPSFPLSDAAQEQMADYKEHFPWFMILPLQEALQPAPAQASWRRVRGVVEDAAWQVFRLPADQLQYVLPQMDQLSQEILNARK